MTQDSESVHAADHEIVSHQLMLRAGLIRQTAAGIYAWLPLGHRVLSRISNIVRREMNGAGAQELLMPALLPADYFRETGRWDSFGDALVRLKDRRGNDYHLGPTHEEIITDLVRREVHRNEEAVHLTPHEYGLFAVLARHAGQVQSEMRYPSRHPWARRSLLRVSPRAVERSRRARWESRPSRAPSASPLR